MNPFDFAGPAFLAFYVGFAAAVIAAAWGLRRLLERSDGTDRLADPYTIAYVRGGVSEAARTAAVSLAKRGLLDEAGGKLRTVGGAGARTTDPLERAVLAAAASGLSAQFVHPTFDAALRPRREDALRRGLLVGPRQRVVRVVVALVAVAALWGVAQKKLEIARMRGKHNVGFLQFLAGAAPLTALLVVVLGRRTPLGQRTIGQLQSILVGVKRRAEQRPDALDATEVALLVAAFGASDTPAGAFPVARAHFVPPPAAGTSSGCGSSSVSSCGGGGSSCGGGGGCGGCGGS